MHVSMCMSLPALICRYCMRADINVVSCGVRVKNQLRARVFVQNDPSDSFLGSEGVLDYHMAHMMKSLIF
jgi:hypothetical protein